MEDKDYLKLIGENISSIRKSKNLSTNEFASRCEMEKSNLIPIEKGRINVTINTLIKIANALNVPLDDLLKF
ncbi:MAG: helix-turn-helix domain-containing protein [Bacteroidia bacterium]|jgi:transcriptional regulator with XRE-family HTH domain|nr:helix-turn-helix domain-containing protein [Bacteroidia bacterium]